MGFRHGHCETHCVHCGRCIEEGESYTTDHSGDVWFDCCDVCLHDHPVINGTTIEATA